MNTRPLPCCESLCGERGLVYLHLFFRPNGRTRYRSEVWRSSGISAGRRTGQPGCLAHSIAHDILRGLLFSRLHSIRPRHLYGIASAAALSSRPPTRPGTVHKESIFALKCSRSKRNKPARRPEQPLSRWSQGGHGRRRRENGELERRFLTDRDFQEQKPPTTPKYPACSRASARLD